MGIDGRERIILNYIKNKNVLDLGVGDTDYRFLHRFIVKHSKSAVGIELDENRAKKLNNQGYNIKVGNAETINLNKKFDVVIAGDLIEHIDNPGLMLDNITDHLKEDGIFICNTPNIYSFNFSLKSLISGGNVKHFHEHTLGFTAQLLHTLFKRHRLKIKKTIYFTHPEKSFLSKIIRLAGKISKKWNENILIIAQK